MHGESMAFHILQQSLLTAQSINATSISIVSGIKGFFLDRQESLAFRVSKTGGTPNIKVQYAISFTGTAINGSFTANVAIVSASRTDFASSAKRWNVVALPNVLTPCVAFRLFGVATNQATGVTVDLKLFRREQF
mgnify:CR=1 FL=1